MDELAIGDAKGAAPGRAGRPNPDACEVPGADPERVERGRLALLDDESYVRIAEVFRTLGDSSRARIVHSLLQQDLCTCDLAAITCLSESAVSQHLRLMKALRLVRTRRDGKKVYYSLDDDHVRFLFTVSLRHLAHEGGEAPAP